MALCVRGPAPLPRRALHHSITPHIIIITTGRSPSTTSHKTHLVVPDIELLPQRVELVRLPVVVRHACVSIDGDEGVVSGSTKHHPKSGAADRSSRPRPVLARRWRFRTEGCPPPEISIDGDLIRTHAARRRGAAARCCVDGGHSAALGLLGWCAEREIDDDAGGGANANAQPTPANKRGGERERRKQATHARTKGALWRGANDGAPATAAGPFRPLVDRSI